MISITVSCQSGSRSFKPVRGKLRGPKLVICTSTEKSINVRPTARFSTRLKRNKIFSFNSTADVAFSPGEKEIYRTSASLSYEYVGSCIILYDPSNECA